MSNFNTYRRRQITRLLACTASGACLVALATPAIAADDDIVVTAQKREQNAQDVPVALTALVEDALVANRVTDITDLTGLAPGLMSRANAGALGSPNIAMRGVSASASQPSQDRQISIYLDGVYLGGQRGVIFDLPDIQRIEVLRGPQGTLFGRNATAGALSIVTRDPKGEVGFTQSVTVGNYAQLRTRTTLDTPQVGPFSAFVTYVHDERRGDTRNLGAGTTFDRSNPFTNVGRTTSPKWLRSKNFESVFAALKFEPTSNFRATYKFDMSDGTSTPEVRAVTAINPNDFVGGMLLAVLAAQPAGGGRYGPVILNPGDRRPDAFNNAWTQEASLKAQGHNFTMEWDATDDITIKNIFSYRKARVFGPTTIVGLSGLEFTQGAVLPYAQFAAIGFLAGQGVDVTNPANGPLIAGTIGAFAGIFGQQVGSYFAGYEGNSYGRSKQWSNETQLNYSNDWLNLTVGGIFYHSFETSSGLPGFAPNFAFGPLPELLPMGNVQDSRSTTDSLAAYLQAEFKVTPQLSIIAGGRVTRDKKVGSLETGGVLTGDRMTGTITGTNFFPWQFKKTKPTFSIGVNYEPNDDILVYGKFSTAFLSGGAVGVLTFAPETVQAAELGIKSEWLDRRLRLNFTAWWAEYKHSQAAQSGTTVGFPQLGVVVIDNGPLKTWGLEFEVVARPTDGLTISGNLGYTNHKLTDPFEFFILSQQNYKHGGIPEWVGNINAQYETQPLFGEATMLFRIDANYQGKYRSISDANIGVAGTPTFAPVFAPYEFTPSRWILNGRVALRDIDVGGASAEIGVWGKNLLNVRKPMFPFPFGNILYTNSYQEARTWGVDVIVKFGSHK